MSTVSQIHRETNTRIYLRNVPSHLLQPYFDARPVLTKYAMMPIVDPRRVDQYPVKVQPTYNPEKVFNPGNAMAPWSGFAANVDKESELRNIVFGLQSCPQAFYVPSSGSDLYKVKVDAGSRMQQQQPFPDLFQQETFAPFDPNPDSRFVGYGLFHNATREQMYDVPNQVPRRDCRK